MFEADSSRTGSLGEPTQLRLRLSGPIGVVLDDADGWVEALVERWMALQVGGH